MRITNCWSVGMKNIIAAFILALCFSSVAIASDEVIVNSITAKISEEIPTSHYQLKVDSRHGHVTLTGEVASETDIRRINEISKNTVGVISVKDRLTVQEGLIAARDGESQELCVRVKDNVKDSNQNLNIECALGDVMITGTVPNEAARARVERNAWNTPGVKSVKTALSFPRPVSDSEITAAVQRALEREGMSVNSVTIASKGGVVHFSGSVPNHRVIDAMLATTLMVDGVRDIRSSVTITR